MEHEWLDYCFQLSSNLHISTAVNGSNISKSHIFRELVTDLTESSSCNLKSARKKIYATDQMGGMFTLCRMPVIPSFVKVKAKYSFLDVWIGTATMI